MRTIKKAAATAGVLAAAVVTAMSAISAYAFSPVELDDRASEVKSGTANIIADQVYAEAGETVTVRVSMLNNTGYAGSGIRLFYDKSLKPVLNGNGYPVMEYGDGSYGLSKTNEINEAEYLIGFGTMGQEDCTTNGTIYTVKFVVPADAAENDEYKLRLEIDKFNDYRSEPVNNNAVDGWIRIKKPEETTVSTTAPTTAPTTPTTTSTVTTVSVTTEEKPETEPTTSEAKPTTVTTTLTTDISTVSNTSKTDRKDPNQGEATTASRANGQTETTKKPATSGTTTTATKTGDAGVGIAAAALMLAATTAAVCKRKKH